MHFLKTRNSTHNVPHLHPFSYPHLLPFTFSPLCLPSPLSARLSQLCRYSVLAFVIRFVWHPALPAPGMPLTGGCRRSQVGAGERERVPHHCFMCILIRPSTPRGRSGSLSHSFSVPLRPRGTALAVCHVAQVIRFIPRESWWEIGRGELLLILSVFDAYPWVVWYAVV